MKVAVFRFCVYFSRTIVRTSMDDFSGPSLWLLIIPRMQEFYHSFPSCHICNSCRSEAIKVCVCVVLWMLLNKFSTFLIKTSRLDKYLIALLIIYLHRLHKLTLASPKIGDDVSRFWHSSESHKIVKWIVRWPTDNRGLCVTYINSIKEK